MLRFVIATAVIITLACSKAYASQRYTCPLEPGKTTVCVMPNDTDPTILKANNPHFIMYDEGSKNQSPLFVWLTGTFGTGLNGHEIAIEMVDAGYRAISLDFISAPNHLMWCMKNRPTDISCPDKALNQRIYGIGGVDNDLDIGYSQTIVSRLIKLLKYMDIHYPKMKWGDYLLNDQPNWSRIVLGGQSLGADISAYIAKDNLVAGVILFSCPWDSVFDQHGEPQLATWISKASKTPADRWYGMYHKREVFAAWIEKAFKVLKIPESHIYRANKDLPQRTQMFLDKACKTGSREQKLYPSLVFYCNNPYHGESCCNNVYKRQRAAMLNLPAVNLLGSDWFLRDFDSNLDLCNARSILPDWCSVWMNEMEAKREKPTDLNLPEWRRVDFETNVKICTTMLPPKWCSEWKEAMREVVFSQNYTDSVAQMIAIRKFDENAKQERSDEWNRVLDHASDDKTTSEDLEVINEHIKDNDPDAFEILAYLHYKGKGVDQSYLKAYENYGRAYKHGKRELRSNLDALWKIMNESDKRIVSENPEFNQ